MPISIRVAGAAFTKIIGVILKTVKFSNFGAFTQTTVNGQYVYSGNGASVANTSAVKLPATTDGYLRTKIQKTGDSLPIMCVKNVNNGTAFSEASTLFGIFINTGGPYSTLQNGSIVSPNAASLSYSVDDIMQLRRVGGNWFAEVSKDGGATFVVIHNFAATSTAEVFPFIQQNGAGTTKFTVAAAPSFVAV